MKALSVRAPWWWAILHMGKPIENRDWWTNFRGTVYLHASKWWVRRDIDFNFQYAVHYERESGRDGKARPVCREDELRAGGGCIVGRVDIVDCVAESDSPWFCGRYGLVLANPVAFKVPVPCKGALGFFTVPDDVLAKLEEQEVCE